MIIGLLFISYNFVRNSPALPLSNVYNHDFTINDLKDRSIITNDFLKRY